MSVNKLSISAIKMPVVLGEVDVLKSILLLPGANAGEAPPVSMWWWRIRI
jgi:hypothetical protein